MLTNKYKNVLYVGVTNDLTTRLKQHLSGENKLSFTSKYKCHYLVYFEHHQYIEHAIEREKEIKGWKRIKKNGLIETENKNWDFLNDEVMEW